MRQAFRTTVWFALIVWVLGLPCAGSVIPNLSIGRYDLQVEAQGFKPFVGKGLTLPTGRFYGGGSCVREIADLAAA